MNIPVTQLLLKMNEHLQKANNQEDGLRENITAIRTLCDLILENQHEVTVVPKVQPQMQVIHPTIKGNQILGDDANGDSLFDF